MSKRAMWASNISTKKNARRWWGEGANNPQRMTRRLEPSPEKEIETNEEKGKTTRGGRGVQKGKKRDFLTSPT